MKKIISFSLWGSDPKYLQGAVENVRLQPSIYPDWICRFYVDSAVPDNIINILTEAGAEIIINDSAEGFKGLFWRFAPAFENTLERFIVRDCDSRLNIREASAVKEWIDSGLPFHSMRDHQYHGVPILGAMWGAVPFFIPDFKNLCESFVKTVNPNSKKRGKYFDTDQLFLNNVIWPRVKDRCIIHDDSRMITGKEKCFPLQLPKGFFVGQQFDEKNRAILI